MDFEEKVVGTTKIYDGKVITVRVDVVILPNGKTSKRELVGHHGGVGIIAVTPEREVFMVSQYRIAAKSMMLEIPAGKLEASDTDTMTAGLRELEEETGYTAKKIEPLGVYYATPGYCEEKLTIYLATELEFVGQHLDEGEFLNVTKYPLDKLYDMVMNNEIHDCKTAIAILKAKAILG